MNKKRRAEVDRIIAVLSDVKERIANVHYEEENAFDNMPENLQESMRAEEMQEWIDLLEEASDGIDEVIETLESGV